MVCLKKKNCAVGVVSITHLHTWRCCTHFTAPSVNTLNTDTTRDNDDTESTVSDCNRPQAHCTLRVMFGHVAERASPTSYEANEQFEDLTSYKFASIQGDSGMSSISSTSGSMTEVAATTIPGVLCHRTQAPRDQLRQRGHGYIICPREGWSSKQNQIAKSLLRYYEQKDHKALHQHGSLHEEQLQQQQRFSKKSRCWSINTWIYSVACRFLSDGTRRLCRKGRVCTKSGRRSSQFKLRRHLMLRNNSVVRKLVKKRCTWWTYQLPRGPFADSICGVFISKFSLWGDWMWKITITKSRILSVAESTETRFSAPTKSGPLPEVTWRIFSTTSKRNKVSIGRNNDVAKRNWRDEHVSEVHNRLDDFRTVRGDPWVENEKKGIARYPEQNREIAQSCHAEPGS